MPQHDTRLALIREWHKDDLALEASELAPASSDASFRRYFRAGIAGGTRIVMDAPPPHEDVRPYLAATALLRGLGVHVPEVFAQDVARGLLLLEDLGQTQYLPRLKAGDDADALYGDAL